MKIVVFGSGNVAFHLAQALDKIYDVAQIISPNISHASSLAKKLKNAIASDNIREAAKDADVYLVSVKDDAIAEVVNKSPNDGLWIHTSGSVGMEVFSSCKKKYGVLYPLQTFSKNADINLSKIPIFIEGNNGETESRILQIAETLSGKVFHAESHQRRQLHISAVFACNFANRLWTIADEVLKEAGYSFNVLEPLLRATLDKALASSPADGQTGPARRGDQKIMASHLSSLTGDKKEIYQLISSSIFNDYNPT